LATTLEWLNRKGLITPNEFLAGEAFGLLVEWRLTLSCPTDSLVYFAARHLQLTPPTQVPLEFVLEDIARGTKASGDDENTLGASIEHVHLGEQYFDNARDRFNRNIYAADELTEIDRVFTKAFPEHPYLMAFLVCVVENPIAVRHLPHTDVPLICSALYTLKEFWREKLLTEAINSAVRCIKKELAEPKECSHELRRSLPRNYRHPRPLKLEGASGAVGQRRDVAGIGTCPASACPSS
jgi:hypothetical protein